MVDEELQKLIKKSVLLNKNKDFLVEVFKYLKKPIETQNHHILRQEIADAYTYMPWLVKLKAEAEAHYRLSQGFAAGVSSLKGTGRDAAIAGETAHWRYVRDLLDGYFDTMKNRLSAAKSILSSIDEELKNGYTE